ncbi:hypothetical protein [Chitinophaga deserti]|uniref:hypothetical protein n=1 Tax=Chitinophaga deserti TaxID=2164099 RepID=UPI000D6BE3A1|nr:hypothetical protein [Chitinophaga deserti]
MSFQQNDASTYTISIRENGMSKMTLQSVDTDDAVKAFQEVGIDNSVIEELEILNSPKLQITSLGAFAKLKVLRLKGMGSLSSLEGVLELMPSLQTLALEETELTGPDHLYLLKHPALKNLQMVLPAKHPKKQMWAHLSMAMEVPILKKQILQQAAAKK